jgi:hypothetical protein
MDVFVTLLAESVNSTVSKLAINHEHIGFIIENGARPEKIMQETRIPGGTFDIVKNFNTRFKYEWGYCWHIQNVPNFSAIMIHRGNYYWDTDGCPLPVSQIALTNGDWYGLNSRGAYNLFMAKLAAHDRHKIHILR